MMMATLTRSYRAHDSLDYSWKLHGIWMRGVRIEVVQVRLHLHCCGQLVWLGGWQDAYRLLQTVCPRHALCGGKTRYDLISSARRRIPPSEL